MGPQKDIRYTESAQATIERAQRKYKEKLESIIRDQKYVPGEDYVEITASDVERATNQVRFVSKRSVGYRELLLKLYMVLGIFAVVLGLFYEQIEFMRENHPEQFMLIIVGTSMIAVSMLLHWYFKRAP